MPAETRTLASARLRARAPRLALIGTAGVLSLAGLRSAVLPPDEPTVGAPPTAAAPAVGPFAEAFAHEYLSWRPDTLAAREERLAGFLADGLEADAGLSPDPSGVQRVAWTAAGTPRAAARGKWTVAVATGLTSGRRVTLTVPVRVAGRALAVSDYPALQALSAPAVGRADGFGDAVQDDELARVVERAARNFLAGRAGDLQADLAPGARVVTPELTARLISVDELAWSRPGRRVAALVSAELEDRSRLRLRLHLDVRRDGRWFIAAIGPTSTSTPTQGAPQ